MTSARRPLFPRLGTAGVLFFQGLGKFVLKLSKPWKKRPSRLPCHGKFFLLILALLAPLAAPALIFERWGTRGHDPIRAIMVGEHPAYTAPMKLNGGAGEMEIYQVEGTPPQVLERLTTGYRALGAQIFCVSGPKLGWGVVLDGGRIIRLLAAKTGQHNTCTLFRMEQTETEFTRSSQVPPAHPLPPDIPEYPGTRWTQAIANDAAHSTTATGTVGADPISVLRYYAEAMPRAGWTPGLGPRDQASSLYMRGQELLLVSANSTGVRGQTVVIFLHKRLK